MPARTKKVFISYAKEDARGALRLYRDLTEAGVGAWLDSEHLLPGCDWRDAISEAIRQCTHFVALLSKKSVSKRGYVQKELKSALDVLDEFPDGEIFLIPARLDDCRPTSRRLRDLHWVDMFPDWSVGLDKILRSIGVGSRRSTARTPDVSDKRDATPRDDVANTRDMTPKPKGGYSGMPSTESRGVCPQCGSTQCRFMTHQGAGAIEYWKCMKCRTDFVYLAQDYT